MKIERSKEWWLSRARREADGAVDAGRLDLELAQAGRSPAPGDAISEFRVAFGRFVNLMRRRRGYTVEQLATAADLDASELLVIEEDVHYVPDPRTVYQLATTFDVPQISLMQVAGLTTTNDVWLRDEAVRFAARSESMQKLTPEESSALEAFIAVLSQRESQEKHQRSK